MFFCWLKADVLFLKRYADFLVYALSLICDHYMRWF